MICAMVSTCCGKLCPVQYSVSIPTVMPNIADLGPQEPTMTISTRRQGTRKPVCHGCFVTRWQLALTTALPTISLASGLIETDYQEAVVH